MAQRQILQLVEQATDSLPDLYRTVFVARVIEGLSIEETASLLGMRPETVKTRLHRARSLVRKRLDEQIGPVLLDAFPVRRPALRPPDRRRDEAARPSRIDFFGNVSYCPASNDRQLNKPQACPASAKEILHVHSTDRGARRSLPRWRRAFAQAADKPTDPQIAHIAYTAGVIDIEAAKHAIAKSKNKDVVAFANDMVRDHEAVNVQALDLVKKLNVTPEDNDTSKALTQAAADERAKLAGSMARLSTRPMSTTRSPTTSRSTVRLRRC